MRCTLLERPWARPWGRRNTLFYPVGLGASSGDGNADFVISALYALIQTLSNVDS